MDKSPVDETAVSSSALNRQCYAEAMGWTHTGATDPYIQDFIQFARAAEGPILDLGCASGHNSKLLLDAGTKSIIANDINEDGLKVLFKSLTNEETERAVALRGNALTLNKILKPGTVGGILAANFLHFLTPSEVRRAFKLFFDLLAPGGKLCVLTFSTKCGLVEKVNDVLKRSREEGVEWPGEVTDDIRLNMDSDAGKAYKLFLDPEDLAREAEMAGFSVEQCGGIPRPEYPKWFQLTNGTAESSGLIAVKPA